MQTEEGKAHYAAYWADHPEPLKIWGMNDTLNPQQATLSWAMIQTDGIKLAEGSKDCLLPANASTLLEQVDVSDVAFVPEQTVLRVRWIKEKHILNETKYFFAPFHFMISQDAKTDVRIRRIKAGQYAVTLLSDRFIWKAHLAEPDGVQYDENDFDLWPGEAKTITAATDREDFVPYLTWIGKEEDA